MICEDTLIIVHGFDISKQIHGPILMQAEMNKLKAKTVRDEINEKGIDLN